jgi:hypothetical protein
VPLCHRKGKSYFRGLQLLLRDSHVITFQFSLSPQKTAKSAADKSAVSEVSYTMSHPHRNANRNPNPQKLEGTRGSAVNSSISRGTKSTSDKEKKIGHRRVGEDGEITYKKIQTSTIMGSIQLGIQHTVSGLHISIAHENRYSHVSPLSLANRSEAWPPSPNVTSS